MNPLAATVESALSFHASGNVGEKKMVSGLDGVELFMAIE